MEFGCRPDRGRDTCRSSASAPIVSQRLRYRRRFYLRPKFRQLQRLLGPAGTLHSFGKPNAVYAFGKTCRSAATPGDAAERFAWGQTRFRFSTETVGRDTVVLCEGVIPESVKSITTRILDNKT